MIGAIVRRLCTCGAAAAILLTACPAQAQDQDRAPLAVDNAEDLAPVAGSHYLIASSMAGGQRASGGLYAVETTTGKVTRLYPAPGATPAGRVDDCPGEVPAVQFKPHGIDLHKGADGRTRLYVVNHGARESIEIFDLDISGAVPALRWAGCHPFPAGPFGNGVAATDSGQIFATNMGKPLDGGKPLSDMGGDVITIVPGGTWQHVPGSTMWGPNGIVARADGRGIVVAAWPARKIYAIDPLTGKRRSLALPFMPDNLKWSGTGTVLATGHLTTAAIARDCYVSTRMHCAIASEHAEIDLRHMRIVRMRTLPVDYATTSVNAAGRCWIGTARGDRIGRIQGRCVRPAPISAARQTRR